MFWENSQLALRCLLFLQKNYLFMYLTGSTSMKCLLLIKLWQAFLVTLLTSTLINRLLSSQYKRQGRRTISLQKKLLITSVREHARHVATLRARHIGTLLREHVSTQSTLLCECENTQGMLAREHARYFGMWARKHKRLIGTWTREHIRHVSM